MKNFKQLILASLFMLVTTNAIAIALPPITGQLDMGGAAFMVDEFGFRTNDALLATTIDFNPNNFRVLFADGLFSGLAGQIGNIQDLSFDTFNGPVADFWTISGFSFELTGVLRGMTNDPNNVLVLNGTGIISNTGFEDTAANWSYVSNTTGNGLFSWSATSAASVPEPGVLAMLSLGLIGIGLRKII